MFFFAFACSDRSITVWNLYLALLSRLKCSDVVNVIVSLASSIETVSAFAFTV